MIVGGAARDGDAVEGGLILTDGEAAESTDSSTTADVTGVTRERETWLAPSTNPTVAAVGIEGQEKEGEEGEGQDEEERAIAIGGRGRGFDDRKEEYSRKGET